MHVTYQCSQCKWVKAELVPLASTTNLCSTCKQLPPVPPPMRTARLSSSLAPYLGSLPLLMMFIAGVGVGSKMVGGW